MIPASWRCNGCAMSELDSHLGRIAQLLYFGGPDTMGSEIITREQRRGFMVRRPGDVDWLPVARWKARTIVSLDRRRVRLVALDALVPGHGSLRALIADIERAGLTPVVVEPHDRLKASLKRWGWKHRRIGHGVEVENIWYRP